MADHRLRFLANSSGNGINPATADKQDIVIAGLDTVQFDADCRNFDAFNRFRVSENYTIYDIKQNVSNHPLFYDDAETSGSGTSSTYNTNKASTTIAVSATTAGTRVRQTKTWSQYQPGKSQVILISLNFRGIVNGVTKRAGLFNPNYGLFFELSGTTAKVVKRTYNTGSAVDTPVSQANWNIDPMDGTGPSEVTVDWEKVQLLFIDYEWLGVGRVRYGMIIDGLIHYVHESNYTNTSTETYMSNPNAPIRFEIANDGTGAAASMDTMCISVQSEGGQQQNQITNYVSRDGTPITLANQDLYTPVLSLRLKSSRLCTRVSLKDVSILLTTAANFEWVLLLNPTIAGVDQVNWVDVTNGSTQYDISRDNTNTVSGGFKIGGGYGASTAPNKLPVGDIVTSFLTIGSNIDGSQDELVLAVMNIDANGGTCYAGITFSEYC